MNACELNIIYDLSVVQQALQRAAGVPLWPSLGPNRCGRVHITSPVDAFPLRWFRQVFQVPHYLAAIRSVDEAVVIGVALSLSSSAFVLQLLTERGELTTKFGSATLGILLAQVTGPARLLIDLRTACQ